MKVETTITQKILTAEDNKWLFNGTTYGKIAIMPINSDETAWREVTEEELPEEEVVII